MDYYNYKVYENGDIWSNHYSRFLCPSPDKDGYLIVAMTFNGKKKNMRLSRVIALCYIPNPDNLPEVDHINSLEITNNNVSNLRWANRFTQNSNQVIRSTNTTGVKGVSLHKKTGLYHAKITRNGKTLQGYYKSFDKAVAKRQEWELEHFCL